MTNNNFITLKCGLIKSWHFEDEFYNENKQLINQLNKVYDKIFEKDCSMFGASETNKNNTNIKNQLCDILDKFFDLKIEIFNNFDNKKYKTKKSYRKYILNYGE